MNYLYSFALLAATVASISASTSAQAQSIPASNIKTKTAIVTTDTTQSTAKNHV